ncbi:MAG: radical SAM protein [Desulfomicrobiaceae bacterium]|jgi:spore photoproduct lyase
MSAAALATALGQRIGRVVVDASVAASELACRVRRALPEAAWHVRAPEEPAPCDAHTLYLKDFRGRFLRPCPGTSQYRCCGYHILHIGENCPLACSYCILQAYFDDPTLKVWANWDDLEAEVTTALQASAQRRWRLGTGEFTDSLALESITGMSAALIRMLEPFANAVLELKSKVVDLSWLAHVRDPRRVLPAWSVNAPDMVESEEHGPRASLEERLAAAKTCAHAGLRVCLHFDPILHYPGWEYGYRQTVTAIADTLRPEQVAYISLGSFRCMPQLKSRIQERFPNARYIHAEMIQGLDGKLRLLRPLRVQQLAFVAGLLRKAGFGSKLYLCMESDLVWRAVLGTTPQDFGGLARRLEALAFGDAEGLCR